MNSSQPVPSLLCLGSLVSSPNTLPSVWGGSRAGGSWLVSGYFLEEEGKERGPLFKVCSCRCSGPATVLASPADEIGCQVGKQSHSRCA